MQWHSLRSRIGTQGQFQKISMEDVKSHISG